MSSAWRERLRPDRVTLECAQPAFVICKQRSFLACTRDRMQLLPGIGRFSFRKALCAPRISTASRACYSLASNHSCLSLLALTKPCGPSVLLRPLWYKPQSVPAALRKFGNFQCSLSQEVLKVLHPVLCCFCWAAVSPSLPTFQIRKPYAPFVALLSGLW